MIKKIKEVIYILRYKQAVRKAKRWNRLTGLRYFVININGGLRVVPKQTLKRLVKTGRFKKGTTIEDIEKRALYITK